MTSWNLYLLLSVKYSTNRIAAKKLCFTYRVNIVCIDSSLQTRISTFLEVTVTSFFLPHLANLVTFLSESLARQIEKGLVIVVTWIHFQISFPFSSYNVIFFFETLYVFVSPYFHITDLFLIMVNCYCTGCLYIKLQIKQTDKQNKTIQDRKANKHLWFPLAKCYGR